MSRTVPIVVVFLLAMGPGTATFAAESPRRAAAAPAEPDPQPGEPAWLGFFLGDAPDGGVKVIAVVEDGPAAKAGIRDGDLLLLVNGLPVTDRRTLRDAVEGLRAGERVVLEILRDGKVESREMKAEPRVIRLRIPSFVPKETSPRYIPEHEARFLLEAYATASGSGVALASIPGDLRRFYGAPGDAGVLVTEVEPESPASAAGLRVGDVLVRAGREPLRAPGDLEVRLALRKPGAPLVLDLVRGGKSMAVSIPGSSGASEARDRGAQVAAIEAEMERLTARIQELRREIERLRKAP